LTLVVARIHSNTIAGTGAPEMPDELLMHQVLKQGTESCETADLKTEEHIMMPGRVIPVREMLGELLLELKQPAMALVAFEQSQKNDPTASAMFTGPRTRPSLRAIARRPARSTHSCLHKWGRLRAAARSSTRGPLQRSTS
jgi:hypothetical protein